MRSLEHVQQHQKIAEVEMRQPREAKSRCLEQYLCQYGWLLPEKIRLSRTGLTPVKALDVDYDRLWMYACIVQFYQLNRTNQTSWSCNYCSVSFNLFHHRTWAIWFSCVKKRSDANWPRPRKFCLEIIFFIIIDLTMSFKCNILTYAPEEVLRPELVLNPSTFALLLGEVPGKPSGCQDEERRSS